MSLVLLALAAAQGVLAQEEGAEAEAARRFQEVAQKAAAAYKLSLATDLVKPEALKGSGQPVLRWSNPLGGRQAHGEVFVWTHRGRPEAAVSIYEFIDRDANVMREHHEWISLSTSRLTASGPRDWKPTAPGIELKPIPDAPEPAESPARRLRQLRELAQRFTASKTTRQMEARDLRVLPQPTYRYESTDPDLLDGALFSLVEATDPEIFLLIETRPIGGKPAWHYALARVNSIRLDVSLDGSPVWTADELPWGQVINRADQPYTLFKVR